MHIKVFKRRVTDIILKLANLEFTDFCQIWFNYFKIWQHDATAFKLGINKLPISKTWFTKSYHKVIKLISFV